MKPAIRVENLSKSYRLGTRATRGYRTLRETINDSVAGAWHVLQRRFGGSGNGTANGHAKDDAFWALKDVSFEVQPGEVVGIIGHNGAGKSTLLKVLSRIVEPTTGRCEVRGRMASLLEVGTGFHPELTGRENIYLNGSILGMSRKEIDRKFDELVAFSEIEKFLDTPVKRYSSGMYVRLAFAVAAHLEMEILVIDEVLAVGDGKFQKKCLGKIGNLAQSGRTVLLVSHNMAAVMSLCQRSVWLSEGRVRLDGPTKPIVAEYTGSDRPISSRCWEEDTAPAGEGVKLRYAAVNPGESETTGDWITVQTSFSLDFEFSTMKEFEELHFALHLEEIERGCVFTTGSRAARCPLGRINGSLKIPGGFLNDGVYIAKVLLVRDRSVVIFEMPHVLAFHVHDVEREGAWYGRLPGAVRPDLPWEVKMVPDNKSSEYLSSTV
jgi:lipopolysaccharide transport system ATP-binding protein